MAHSPLLRQLQRACRDAAVSVGGPAAASGLTRRNFLKATAAVGAAATIGPVLLPARPVDAARGPRVVVVGAGLAGLTCAYRLMQQGYYVDVFEASRRLGGRCFTGRGIFADNQIIERGGELIDSHHEAIRNLATELGLELDDLHAADPADGKTLYYFQNQPYLYEDALRDFKQIWHKLQADVEAAPFPTRYDEFTARGKALDHMSIVDWIKESVPGGMESKLGQLLAVAYNIEFGAEPEQQSALNLLYLLAYSADDEFQIFGESDERYHIRGGNDQLVTRMAEMLGDQIIMGARLVAIRRSFDRRRYVLTFESGVQTHTVIADYVVMAIPFTILRSAVDYAHAGFSERKRMAIEEMGMGDNVKFHMQFDQRVWAQQGYNGESYTDKGYQSTWEVTRAQPGKAGILVNFAGGNYARSFSAGRPPQRAEEFLKQADSLMPGLRGAWNGKATVDYWPGNRWTRGSYSYYKPGQYTKFAGVEGEREGNCFFCGEHTSMEYQGYLNGAVDSGERAAQELLDELTEIRTQHG